MNNLQWLIELGVVPHIDRRSMTLSHDGLALYTYDFGGAHDIPGAIERGVTSQEKKSK